MDLPDPGIEPGSPALQADSLLSYWGIELDFCDVEWFALETNQDHSVIFKFAPKYHISDSFVDYEGYSISSMGFLLTVVDIIVIRIEFTHSRPF